MKAFLIWIYNSRKMKIALGALIAVVIMRFGVSEEAAEMWADKILALAMVLIAGIAIEDGAEKLGGKKPDGTGNGNVGGDPS